MRKQQLNATMIRLESTDREAITRIKEVSVCPSDSTAIKRARRMVARGEGPPPIMPQEERPSYPHG